MNIEEFIDTKIQKRVWSAVEREKVLNLKEKTKDSWYLYVNNVATFHKTRYALFAETFFGEKLTFTNTTFKEALFATVDHMKAQYNAMPLHKRLTYFLALNGFRLFLDVGEQKIACRFSHFGVEHVSFYKPSWEEWWNTHEGDARTMQLRFQEFMEGLYPMLIQETDTTELFDENITINDLTIEDATSSTSLSVNGSDFRVNFYPKNRGQESVGIVLLNNRPINSNLAEILLKIDNALVERSST